MCQSPKSEVSTDTCSDSEQSTQAQAYPILNGHFKLLKELGEGGTSKVYLA
jgi:hypothetical protein